MPALKTIVFTARSPAEEAIARSSTPTYFEDPFLEGFEEPTLAVARTTSTSDLGTIEKTLLKLSGYPEVKRTWVKKCRGSGRLKVCIKWPQLWRRSSTLAAVLVVTYPRAFERDVKECIGFAVTGAVIAAVASKNIALATKTFKLALIACLTKKGSEAAKKVGASIKLKKIPGEWRKV